MNSGIPIIISAPSGTGKSTICKVLREKTPHLNLSISHTTRKPRPGETDGVDYFFVSEDQFKKKIDEGYFLEWAKIHNNYYGTAFDSVDMNGKLDKHTLLEVDVQGVETLRKIKFEAVFIMIVPPSIKELQRRLRNRSTESEDKIQQRLEVGKREIARYNLYDYVITNHDIEKTVHSILSIISVEEARSTRFLPPSKDIAKILNNKTQPI